MAYPVVDIVLASAASSMKILLFLRKAMPFRERLIKMAGISIIAKRPGSQEQPAFRIIEQYVCSLDGLIQLNK